MGFSLWKVWCAAPHSRGWSRRSAPGRERLGQRWPPVTLVARKARWVPGYEKQTGQRENTHRPAIGQYLVVMAAGSDLAAMRFVFLAALGLSPHHSTSPPVTSRWTDTCCSRAVSTTGLVPRPVFRCERHQLWRTSRPFDFRREKVTHPCFSSRGLRYPLSGTARPTLAEGRGIRASMTTAVFGSACCSAQDRATPPKRRTASVEYRWSPTSARKRPDEWSGIIPRHALAHALWCWAVSLPSPHGARKRQGVSGGIVGVGMRCVLYRASAGWWPWSEQRTRAALACGEKG